MSNQSQRAVPLVLNLAIRSEAEGREIVKVLDPDQLEVDIEASLKLIETKGERTERRRR